jgi:hypothetical protein
MANAVDCATLIAGPNVYICDRCTVAAIATLAERRSRPVMTA